MLLIKIQINQSMEKNLTIKLAVLTFLILIKVETACSANQTQTSIGCMKCPGNQVPSPAQDRCICPANTYIGWDGVNCISCPANMIVKPSGDGCQCPAGTYLAPDGNCRSCANGFSVNAARDKCLCPPPRQVSGANCICPSPFIDSAGVCVCQNNQIFSNGVCSCPFPLIRNGAICSCAPPLVAAGSSCICPNSKIYSGGRCLCPSPLIENSAGACVCPDGSSPSSSGSCAGCGNRVLDAGQQCDSTAGCTNCKCDSGFTSVNGICRSSAVCGDGVLQGSEVCDNGVNPGCTIFCQVEPGYRCNRAQIPGSSKFKSDCVKTCGNGVLDQGQACDNGNQIGCSQSCRVDQGYQCRGSIGARSECGTACGDGIRTDTQACDNGNKEGCTNCNVDAGWTCNGLVGATSRCTRNAYCGNGILQPGQQCDNGGRLGCLNNCKPDPGYTCFGVAVAAGTVCSQCGNGIVEAGQECDNGGKAGCRFNCRVDPGYDCKGSTSSACNKADSKCGNGAIQVAEACDDGNKNNGDGCNQFCVVQNNYKCVGQFGQRSQCTLKATNNATQPEPVCGNGKYEPMTKPTSNQGQNGLNGFNPTDGNFGFNAYYGEQCDNGNQVGCRGCVVEKDWTCTKPVNRLSVCTPNIVINPCGNGIYQPEKGEQCDDGNIMNGDGCNVFCNVQAYWTCPNGVKCFRVETYTPDTCGNGKYETTKGQQCDDGNKISGDGCSPQCKVQSGYGCGQACSSQQNPRCNQRVEGKKSTCKKLYSFCGNGIVDGSQQCDDGFPLYNGDGCDNKCRIQKGWNCYGARNAGLSKCYKI